MPQLEGGILFEQINGANTISIQREAAVTVFENAAVMNTDRHARALGAYGSVVLGRDLKAEFISFSTPRHLFSSRKDGCTWNPKGGVRIGIRKFPTCPIEYDGEQCPDAFYGTCFERIFGTGNNARDLMATAEGQAIMSQLLTRVMQGLGNSFDELYNYANHPLISLANTAGTYKAGTKEWTDYVDQQMSGECGGLITQLDELKSKGIAGFTLELPVSGTGAFSGSFVTELEKLKAQASAELQAMMQNGLQVNGVTRYPIIFATAEVFNSYKNYIKSLAGTNELAYRYMLEGADGTTKMMANVLVYDNMPIVMWEAPGAFDALVGTRQHRLAIVAPGAFGVLHDVDDLQQFAGMGLVLQQSPLLKDKGKIYMTTTLRWGAGIAGTALCAMSSTVLAPVSA